MQENQFPININDSVFQKFFFELVNAGAETRALISRSTAILERLEHDVRELTQTAVRKSSLEAVEKRVKELEDSTKRTDRLKLLLVGVVAGLMGSAAEILKFLSAAV